MEQLVHFVVNHWALWLALVVVLLLLFTTELYDQKKRAKEISPQAAVNLINHENAVVIDLRDKQSFAKGHIIHAILGNAEDFSQQRMDKYKKNCLLLVCAKGLQSSALAVKLHAQGFHQILVLAGGLAAWQNAELPLVKGK